jgi:transposase-like protein
MPWRHTSPTDQKIQFIADYLRQTRSISELCELYGVRRNTGDQWIARSLKHGPLGLEERSRQPHSSPRQTPKPLVEAFIERRRHGRSPRAPHSVRSYAAMAWCLSADTWAIRGSPPARS